MNMVVKFILTLAGIVTLLVIMFKMVSYNIKFLNSKSSTFECGFDLMTNLRLPFSLNFYIISIIFLIFDVELILLLPFVFVSKLTVSSMVHSILIMFFLVLVVGFIYEWWMGLLNWMI